MTKKIVFGAALALVIVGLMAPSASALCNPPKFVSTYNGGSGAFAYWHSTLAETPGATLVGKLWNGSTDLTGTCNTACTGCGTNSGFLYFGSAAGDIGLNVSLGDQCQGANVCPSGSISVLAGVTKGSNTDFLATQGLETAGFFDFSTTGHAMLAHPRPRVTNSQRSGTNVNLAVAVDAAAPALFDSVASQITGCNILTASSAADPGRLASAYTLLGPCSGGVSGAAATAGGASNCTDITKDNWIVVQEVTAAGPSPFVGAATRVRCNSAVADPKPFKIINNKVGTKTDK